MQRDWHLLDGRGYLATTAVRKRPTPTRWTDRDEAGLRAHMRKLDVAAARRVSSTRRAARTGEVTLADGRTVARAALGEGTHRLAGGGVINVGERACRSFLGQVRCDREDGKRDHLRGTARRGRSAVRAGALARLVEGRGLSRVLEDLVDRDPVTLAAVRADPANARVLATALGAL
jgi:hypothetical protein